MLEASLLAWCIKEATANAQGSIGDDDDDDDDGDDDDDDGVDDGDGGENEDEGDGREILVLSKQGLKLAPYFRIQVEGIWCKSSQLSR